jgi:hypothetical protein
LRDPAAKKINPNANHQNAIDRKFQPNQAAQMDQIDQAQLVIHGNKGF